MLEITFLRENPDKVKEGLRKKHFSDPDIVDRILELDQQRRSTQKLLDDALAQGKLMAKEIGALMQQGRSEEANAAREKTGELKQLAKDMAEALDKVTADQDRMLTELPNLPHYSVPEGRHVEDNLVVHQEGEILSAEGLLPHWELAAKGRIIDFELGSKISGAGFPVYRGAGARLQRALINFFLEEGIRAGYEEYQPPLVVNADSGFGTGQLPDKEGQMYYVTEDDLYLIPTAEVPVTNFYRDVILREDELPIRNVAYSSCFRREAGSYGKDVRGLNRLHQFDKVEIVQVEHPERSYETLELMRAHVEGLLRKLELPYRVLLLCGGDMSFTSAKTYDMEVWSAGQSRWLEVSSISNFETFQSNRMKLRFKGSDGRTRLAHTLNGSALALPRIVAALLENNQDGNTIHIPAALQPYTGFDLIQL
ncbi:MAG: serine--tRNA ligase [Bacteroidales bacterium]|nr:serine--tRNA ligase [Bacteroidales bacterium]